MKSKSTAVIEILEPKKHPAHARHHPAAHHWSATVLLIFTVICLFVLVIVSVGRSATTPSYKPSSEALSSEAATTMSGVASDFSQLHAADVPSQ